MRAFTKLKTIANSRFCTPGLVAAVLIGLAPLIGHAARPSAMKLFPEESLVFIRVANGHEMGEKMRQTSIARMIHDPQLHPLIENLYGKAGKLYEEEAESKLGLKWEDLKNLPKGEVAFAVVARPDKLPAFLLMIDQGGETSVVDKLVDRALDIAQEKGGEFSKEKFGDTEVTVVRDRDKENRMFGVCQRENTIIAATDADLIRGLLWHWDRAADNANRSPASAATSPDASTAVVAEQKSDAKDGAAVDSKSEKQDEPFVPGRTLAENDRFATIVKTCRRPQDPPPHLLFYIDPIELARGFGHGNAGLSFVLGLFPSLGLDGVQAVGGTFTYATEEYDSIAQLHLLLENPRSGVLLLPAFIPGDTAPQPFVPAAIESYMAWNWSVRTTYDRLAELIDKYRYQGSVDKFVKEKLSEKLGVDVPTKIIDNLKGRYTWTIGYERPSHFQGQRHVFAAELNDEKAAQETLKTVMDKYPQLFAEKNFGSATYYELVPGGIKPPVKKGDPESDETLLNPFVAIMDGYFFVGTSYQRFEEYVAARDGTVPRLVDSNEYAQASAVIGKEVRGVTPVMFTMGRFEESLRQWYDLLTSDKTRSYIDEHREKNKWLAALADAMQENKLPPFEVLVQYAPVNGSILYDTDNGYHAITFSLRSAAMQAAPAPADVPASSESK
jgi:hypothetical protein